MQHTGPPENIGPKCPSVCCDCPPETHMHASRMARLFGGSLLQITRVLFEDCTTSPSVCRRRQIDDELPCRRECLTQDAYVCAKGSVKDLS